MSVVMEWPSFAFEIAVEPTPNCGVRTNGRKAAPKKVSATFPISRRERRRRQRKDDSTANKGPHSMRLRQTWVEVDEANYTIKINFSENIIFVFLYTVIHYSCIHIL